MIPDDSLRLAFQSAHFLTATWLTKLSKKKPGLFTVYVAS